MLLKEQDCKKVQLIKSKVKYMLEERGRTNLGENASQMPSEYWSYFCDKFKYMLDLPDPYYGQLRFHTYHLDGETYQPYFFNEERVLSIKADWERLIKNIPKKYWLSAAPCLSEPGYNFDGFIINTKVLRHQHIINIFLREGILKHLQEKSRRVYILEIGAGYGALAYHLSKILENVTYIIIDLPETLLFSSVYLSICAPEKSIYMYDRDYPIALEGNLSDYNFILLPNLNSVLKSLEDMKFDLVLNEASLQEMSYKQLEVYLEFISKTLNGEFYSWNQDVQPQNREGNNLSALLKEKFNVQSIQYGLTHSRLSRLLNINLKKIISRLSRNHGSPRPYREYICTKK